jgi:membrane fusion protein, copper/silver efflux system
MTEGNQKQSQPPVEPSKGVEPKNTEKKSQKPAKKRMQVPVLLVLLIGAAMGWFAHPDGEVDNSESSDQSATESDSEEAPDTLWTCSMHPTVQLPDPGQCPICNMDLIPLVQSAGEDTGPSELRMSETAVALAEISTTPVERREVAHEVLMVGKIALDETRMAAIPAWFSGRIDKIFVDTTHVPVKKGDHLVSLYSPDLYAAERDFLEARDSDPRLASAARGRLRLLGVSEEQIRQLEIKGSPNENEVVFATIDGIVTHKNALLGRYVEEGEVLYEIADLSQVWLDLEAYETDLPWIRFGQEVSFKVLGWPGDSFGGRIALISPILDEKTRSIHVRVHVDNTAGKLRPGMIVQARVQAQMTSDGRTVDPILADLWMCPMHPEVQETQAGDCPKCGMDLVQAKDLGFVADGGTETPLVIPSTAPLLTGKRAVVYVRLPGKEPHFQGREIVLGPRAGDWFVVREGLMEGELVVDQGAYRLDAELQLTGKVSMMSPKGGGSSGHDHGEMAAGTPMPTMLPHEMKWEKMEASQGFRQKMGALASAYLPIQDALATDGLSAAQAAANASLTALAAMPHDGIDAEAHGVWMGLNQRLKKSLEEVAGAPDLAAARQSFVAISAVMIESVQRFGAVGAGKMNIAFCPMADNDKGADWLQMGDDIRNPYYGSDMLTCGEIKTTLNEDQ